MPRPKLKKEERKGKIGITLSNEIILKLNTITNNKSRYIEEMLLNEFKNNK